MSTESSAGIACSCCGRGQTEAGELTVQKPFLRPPAWRCTRCQVAVKRRIGLLLWLLHLGVPLFVWTLPLWRETSAITHLWGLISSIYVLMAVGVGLHEGGHAVVGWLVGYRIAQIRWGVGPLIYSWSWRETDCQLRRALMSGLVLGLPKATPNRVRAFLFSAGGPLVNATLIAIGICLLPGPGDGDNQVWRTLPPALIIANGFLLFSSLVPRHVQTDIGQFPSDGLAMLRTLLGNRTASLSNGQSTDGRKRSHAIASRLLLFVTGIAAAISGTLLILLFHHVSQDPMPNPSLWVAWLLLGGLCAVSTAMTVRLWRKRDFPPPDAAHGMSSDLSTMYADEIRRMRASPADHALDAIHLKVAALTEAGEWKAALELITTHLAYMPADFWLRHVHADLLAKLGRRTEAVAEYDRALGVEGLGEAGRLGVYQGLINTLAAAGAIDKVRSRSQIALNSLTHPPWKINLLESLCALVIFQGRREYLSDADVWSAEALALSNAPTLKGTRGSILMELGRLDEAEAILQQCLNETDSSFDRTVGNFYLALIAHERGDSRQAGRRAWIALNQDSHPMIHRRLKEAGIKADY